MGRIIDLTNQRFGKLVVLNCAGKLNNKDIYWNCQCDCGVIKPIRGCDLRSGNTKSCGCNKYHGLIEYNYKQSEEAKIPIGTKFGKLTIIEDLGFKPHVQGHNRRWYKCLCECGRTKDVMANSLKTGSVLSCGCLISKGEYIIMNLLDDNNISYTHDQCLDELYNDSGRRLRFDFILYQDNNIMRIIEFDGRQHTQGPDTDYWSHSKDDLVSIQLRDNLKNDFCWTHKIPLVRIPYTHINQITIDDLLGEKFLIKE